MIWIPLGGGSKAALTAMVADSWPILLRKVAMGTATSSAARSGGIGSTRNILGGGEREAGAGGGGEQEKQEQEEVGGGKIGVAPLRT